MDAQQICQGFYRDHHDACMRGATGKPNTCPQDTNDVSAGYIYSVNCNAAYTVGNSWYGMI